MLNTGLVSITFRKLAVGEIAELMKKTALDYVEWGGDIHVPPLDSTAISAARDASRKNGIKISSYGSYYKANGGEDDIEANVKTASLLGADYIRIWAGTHWSNDIDEDGRADVVKNIRKTCACAKKYGITVCPEFHQATLTDELDSALRLLDEVAEDNFKLYWQPNQFKDDEYNLRAVRTVLPYLTNVHVFSWAGNDKFPLADGERMWKQYIDVLRSDGRDHNLMLEFVCDGTVDQLCRDAETLNEWLK